MPVKGKRVANNPVSMAETVLSRLDQVPWGCAVFLNLTRSGRFNPILYRENDPEVDRSIKIGSLGFVGTYTSKVAESDLIADLLETMARMR